jgi:hypothetical protein
MILVPLLFANNILLFPGDYKLLYTTESQDFIESPVNLLSKSTSNNFSQVKSKQTLL